MKEIMQEYGSTFAAVTGAVIFFGVIEKVLLSQQGIFMQMIRMWTYGGV